MSIQQITLVMNNYLPTAKKKTGKKNFSSPVTFDPIARRTSMSKIDLWNVKLRFMDNGVCGNVRYNIAYGTS